MLYYKSMKKTTHALERFFKDKDGKVVIGQTPNAPILVWAVLLVANLFIHNSHIGTLQNVFLFVWAYLELTDGVNYFRKALGAVIALGIIVGILI